jgi:hypothetical protein
MVKTNEEQKNQPKLGAPSLQGVEIIKKRGTEVRRIASRLKTRKKGNRIGSQGVFGRGLPNQKEFLADIGN